VRELFAVDPLHERYVDPARALDLGRAANAELMAGVFTEWRRPASSSGGGLVLALRDLRAGAGWGLIDSDGTPKAPYHALRRVWQPIAVLLTDEGLNGLLAHVVNDTAEPFTGTLRCELLARGEVTVDDAAREIEIAPRAHATVDLGALFDGFRDLTYAYRFSPPALDVVVVTLVDTDGTTVSEAVHLPLGLARPLEADLGLTVAVEGRPGAWIATLSTRRFAQSVAFDVPGFAPSDSWFHLPPGRARTITLVASNGHEDERPRGRVRALNARGETALRVEG
jgi:beta-mannosidase